MKRLIALILFLLSIYITYANESVVMTAARKELARTMTELKKQQTPPYFLSYSITDVKNINIYGTLGKIESEQNDKNRYLDIDLRVGDYKFDNSHIIRGNRFSFSSSLGSTELPLENDEAAIRNAIWFATDKEYKEATETLQKALTNKAVKVKEEDSSADFTAETPNKYYEESKDIKVDIELIKNRMRILSSKFIAYDWILESGVKFMADIETKYFISSEGTELQYPAVYFRIFVSAKAKAEDGMSIPLYKSYFAFSPDSLPSNETIAKDIDDMIKLIDDLRKAPTLQSTYSGPAILSGKAAGVFFHEIFGHRVEGHREKDPNSSQTFKNMVGQKILPDFIDVVMDPTIQKLRGMPVSGYFKYDDEGIKAQKVMVAENGKFENFLMSRSPIEKFPHSNGHGRKQFGYKAVSRQSNLIVNAHETVSVDKLKEMLRDDCKKQNKEFGLYFDVVQGGFTFTGRTIPNAFNVNPLVVYKVFADGRKDELIRGLDLIGTPLATFANITAAADDLDIFNGICGAESGGVAVSASSPSLLVSMIEVQKKAKSQAKPPILTAP
jgi:TldD protein